MTLLGVLTTILVLALVGVLVWALVAIWRALVITERYLAQVTMGLRAIETQTAPLKDYLGAVNGHVATVQEHLGRVGEALAGFSEMS